MDKTLCDDPLSGSTYYANKLFLDRCNAELDDKFVECDAVTIADVHRVLGISDDLKSTNERIYNRLWGWSKENPELHRLKWVDDETSRCPCCGHCTKQKLV